MKLGLLAVVAVAVLLPSISESRIVSKCELRDKLREKIKLPRRLEEGILATVICEVDRRSHLNTAVVTVIGKPIPTTPKPTTVSKMTTAATIQPTSASSKTTQLTNTTTTTTTNPTTNTTATNTTTANPTTNTTATNTTAANPTTNTTATNTTAANPTTNTTATNTTAANPTTNTTATNTTASPATTNSTIISVNTTLVLNSTGGIKRRKREVDSSSEEDASFHGLFQLSDTDFCDSGYHQSENECCTSCTAFTDDDITDDIACVVKTGHWRQIFESASDSCRRTSNFFRECN